MMTGRGAVAIAVFHYPEAVVEHWLYLIIVELALNPPATAWEAYAVEAQGVAVPLHTQFVEQNSASGVRYCPIPLGMSYSPSSSAAVLEQTIPLAVEEY